MAECDCSSLPFGMSGGRVISSQLLETFILYCVCVCKSVIRIQCIGSNSLIPLQLRVGNVQFIQLLNSQCNLLKTGQHKA